MTTSITREQGYTGFSPELVRIVTTSTLSQVTTAGWYNNSPIAGESLSNVDMVLICYSYGTSSQFTSQFNVAISSTGVVTLSLAYDSEVGPQLVTTSVSSATPGTVRSFTGSLNQTATVMTSGNIVGVRGVVTMVGASGGFIYGAEGKVILSGTLSGSEWTAGVFGQLDISAATINAGQIAPIWGDYGTSSGTLTNETGMYGIAMTNTTAAVLAGQIYLYGGATNLLLLNTNSGLSGTTYFIAAGTGSTSWGYVDYAPATYVLKISVNGTTYYLPLKSSNS